MSSKFSHMDFIIQHFHKMHDRIQALELENSNLKKLQNDDYDKLKQEFANLSERHKELKEAFLESENQVKLLTTEKEEIIQKEKELSELIKNEFEQFSQTPKRPISNIENESQKMKYLRAKKAPRKLELHSMYESESDSDDSKVNFNLMNLLPKEELNSEEESMNVMKKIIGNDLWNCMESSLNSKQQSQDKCSQTKSNQDGLFDAYLETHGKNVDFLRSKEERFPRKINNSGLFDAYLATHGKNVDFLRSQTGGTKK
jgi:hypothetical protein